MSSKSSKRGKKNKSGSGSASEAGSTRDLVEREDPLAQSIPEPKSQTEPTSAESQSNEQKRDFKPATPVQTGLPVTREEIKSPDTNSVYGDVVRDDPIPVQVAILEPEIPVAQPVPMEQVPIQPQPEAESGGLASLFSCCVLRK